MKVVEVASGSGPDTASRVSTHQPAFTNKQSEFLCAPSFRKAISERTARLGGVAEGRGLAKGGLCCTRRVLSRLEMAGKGDGREIGSAYKNMS